MEHFRKKQKKKFLKEIIEKALKEKKKKIQLEKLKEITELEENSFLIKNEKKEINDKEIFISTYYSENSINPIKKKLKKIDKFETKKLKKLNEIESDLREKYKSLNTKEKKEIK